MNRTKPYLLVALFAVYPVLAAYAYNAGELELTQMGMPLLVSLLIAAVLFPVITLISREKHSAGILTALFLVIFWYYGMIQTGISGTIVLRHWVLLPLVLILYGLAFYGILKISKQKTLETVTTIFLIPVALLVLFNLARLIPAEVQKHRAGAGNAQAIRFEEETHFGDLEHAPDIYILVFDEFASIPSMEKHWGHDHSGFVEKLQDLGFFVAENSKTRYTNTLRSLPSLMNLAYMDEDMSSAELYRAYDENFLMDFLDRSGYEIFFIDGWGSFEYSFGIEDINFYCMYNTYPEDEVIMDPFHYLLLRQSLVSPLARYFRDDTSNLYYRVNNYFLNFIRDFPDKTADREHPVMLYSHLMTPHLPFVFDRDGNFMENPTNYWEYESVDNQTKRELYLEQYLYISDRILEISAHILADSAYEPVIVILSDHGVREQSTGVDSEEDSHRVFNAVYFPGRDYSMLYDNIAPVNTLRVMMNQFFQQDYSMPGDI